MLQRRYCAIIECDVQVREVEPRFSVDSTTPPDRLRDMRLLQDAIIATPEVLDAWIRAEIMAELGGFGEITISGIAMPDEEEMLMSVVESLGPGTRHRLRESLARNTLIEDAEELFMSFTIDMVRTSPVPPSVRPQDTLRHRTQHPGAPRLRRCYHVFLDADVDVADFTVERLAHRFESGRRDDCADDPAPPEPYLTTRWFEDQRILHDALLSMPDALDEWLRADVAAFLDLELMGTGTPWPRDLEAILAPVVESLPPRQRHIFRESLARGTIVRHAGDFMDSFDVTFALNRIERVDGSM